MTLNTLSQIIQSNKTIIRALGVCSETSTGQLEANLKRLSADEKRELINALNTLDRSVREIQNQEISL